MMLNDASLHWLLLHNEPKSETVQWISSEYGEMGSGAVLWGEDARFPPCSYFP